MCKLIKHNTSSCPDTAQLMRHYVDKSAATTQSQARVLKAFAKMISDESGSEDSVTTDTPRGRATQEPVHSALEVDAACSKPEEWKLRCCAALAENPVQTKRWLRKAIRMSRDTPHALGKAKHPDGGRKDIAEGEAPNKNEVS